jgi:hypothetical protein
MRAYVFTDKALERHAGRFVWLSIDTEDPKNTGFLAKYPVEAWPTLMVLDSSGNKVLLRYVGGATVGQLAKILEGASRKTGDEPGRLVTAADKLAFERAYERAAEKYEAALQRAPAGWPHYGRTAEALIYSLGKLDNGRCAREALELSPKLAGSVSGANVAAMGLGCAIGLEGSQSRKDLAAGLEKHTRSALQNPQLDLSADDRSGLYTILIAARQAANDKHGADTLRREWVAFLERSAAEAKTPEQRAVYDPHRLTAYIELGTPQKAIPMLEQSERDLPQDYNPPARLAAAYRALKQYDAALVASERALARSYGPRKLQLLGTRAEIFAGKGDKESARRTLNEALAYAKQLPKAQQNPRAIPEIEKKLAELSAK